MNILYVVIVRWEMVVGYGSQYGIDLNQFRVISASPLGKQQSLCYDTEEFKRKHVYLSICIGIIVCRCALWNNKSCKEEEQHKPLLVNF